MHWLAEMLTHMVGNKNAMTTSKTSLWASAEPSYQWAQTLMWKWSPLWRRLRKLRGSPVSVTHGVRQMRALLRGWGLGEWELGEANLPVKSPEGTFRCTWPLAQEWELVLPEKAKMTSNRKIKLQIWKSLWSQVWVGPLLWMGKWKSWREQKWVSWQVSALGE